MKFDESILEKARTIRLLILDVDGVLTDGRLVFDDRGREYKAFHSRDGHGIRMLGRSGVQVAVISGRKSEPVARRMASLGVEHVYQGHEDKRLAFGQLCSKLEIQPAQVAHVGDDFPDLPLMRMAGLGIAVHDAHEAVRKHADWCTRLPGGAGAVREVCDLIMTSQHTYEAALQTYLETAPAS